MGVTLLDLFIPTGAGPYPGVIVVRGRGVGGQ
jgi:hypothetical protein